MLAGILLSILGLGLFGMREIFGFFPLSISQRLAFVALFAFGFFPLVASLFAFKNRKTAAVLGITRFALTLMRLIANMRPAERIANPND